MSCLLERYCMMAQLSQMAPFGKSFSSSIGVRCAGFFARNSGERVLPQTSSSVNSRLAARTKTRAAMLFTLGFSTFSFMVSPPLSSPDYPAFSIRILRRSICGKRRVAPRHQRLDGVGEMNLCNVAIVARDTDLVSFHQHVRMRKAVRRFKPVAGKLDQEAHWIGEIDRIHEASVLDAAMGDPAFVQTLYCLREGGVRDRKGDMMHAAGLRRRPARVGLAALVGENGDEPAIAGIEIEMAFGRLVEIWLLEHEGHAEHALPEIDGCLAVGSGERDVVYTLALELLHRVHAELGT